MNPLDFGPSSTQFRLLTLDYSISNLVIPPPLNTLNARPSITHPLNTLNARPSITHPLTSAIVRLPHKPTCTHSHTPSGRSTRTLQTQVGEYIAWRVADLAKRCIEDKGAFSMSIGSGTTVKPLSSMASTPGIDFSKVIPSPFPPLIVPPPAPTPNFRHLVDLNESQRCINPKQSTSND
jgi:hypothetical protein